MMGRQTDIRNRPMTDDERRGYDHALDSLALWAEQIERSIETTTGITEVAARMRAARHMALALKHGTGGPADEERLRREADQARQLLQSALWPAAPHASPWPAPPS